MVNEKRYGRRSRPDASYSEDLYSADDESMIESQPESRLSDSRVTSEVDHHETPTREVRTLRVLSFGAIWIGIIYQRLLESWGIMKLNTASPPHMLNKGSMKSFF